MNEIKKLFEIVGHRKQTVVIMLLGIVVGLVEFIGLALLIPYVSIATQKEVPQNGYLEAMLTFFNINGFHHFIIFITAIVCVFYIFRLALNLYFNYKLLKFINKIRHIILTKLFSHYAHIDYANFASRNTSNFKKTLLSESLNIQVILKSMIDIVSELSILILLLCMIFYTDWRLSIVLIVLFGSMFFGVTTALNKKVADIAKKRKEFASGVHRHVDETLNNFKYIKLIGSEKVKTDLFERNSYGLTQVNTIFGLLNQSPRFILETMGLLIIVGIIFYLVQQGSSESLMSTLAIYAIAFYRALPSLNRIIMSANSFHYFKNTIDQVYEDLQLRGEKHLANDEIEYRKRIELRDMTFSHKNANTILFERFNLTIDKGEKIALTGSSGSGKSTLVDIIMGILKPQNGFVTVDNKVIDNSNVKAWRKMFGYIPQDIYLYDASVADNVTFGREYDEKRVIDVLKQANIYEYLQTKEGIETCVGEGGVQLSGGQKQRIGIARALYNDPEILVLDEATSALDSETEEKIMEEIYTLSKDKTLIIIAHRLSTINRCERRIEL